MEYKKTIVGGSVGLAIVLAMTLLMSSSYKVCSTGWEEILLILV